MKVMENTAVLTEKLPALKGTGKSILIVDDDADTRWLLGELLTSEGYAVEMAESAESAMMLLYNFRPDAVLMDVRLPGMDGLQLTGLIQLTSSRKVPIVAVSGGDNEYSVQDAYEAGCDGYIAKPVNPETFAASVGQYLANRS
jgi:CheY-like chemotaxis protein